ncbi:hypothetical protein [Afifella aestuarii]|uniref:hypothetical protein n=1 Tax=Afifella aestuarii TaxID=1909496 RepID=UPI000FE3C576|nr:hypothetical protein [Afifella aestuarii]
MNVCQLVTQAVDAESPALSQRSRRGSSIFEAPSVPASDARSVFDSSAEEPGQAIAQSPLARGWA